MTAQERYDYLYETVFVPTNTLVTIGMIRDSIGLTPEQYGLVRSTLDRALSTLKASANPVDRVKGMDLGDALSVMLDRGLSLSNPDRQATIDTLAAFGSWPDTLRDAIKTLGGTTKANWEVEGYSSAPTLEQVTEELDVIDRAEIDRLRTGYLNNAKAAIQSTFDNPTATVDDVLAAFDTAFRTEWGA